MTEITEVSEALKLLNTLVERTNLELPEDAWLTCSRLGPLVPAMVKGARAVLEYDKDWKETRSKYGTPGNPTDDGMSYGQDKIIIALANAYRPAMVELGWVSK